LNPLKLILKIGRRLANLWLMIVDPKRLSELSGERVVFNHLKKNNFLDDFKNKRILEIGPKHGQDSMLLASLKPKQLTLVDLPEKKRLIKKWLPKVKQQCKTKYLEANILYLSQKQYKQLGKFDLIWCLGVLYHNVEQLRLIKRLFDLCNTNGCLVIESATTRNKKLEKLNIVEVHWPKTYRNLQTITHLPSRLAIKSWLEMVGFVSIKIWDIYSKTLVWQRSVLTCRKNPNPKPYINYSNSNLNLTYSAGKAA